MRHKVVTFLVAGMLLSAPALSGAQSQGGQDRAATIAALEQRAEVLEQAPPNPGAVRRQQIAKERAQIQELIGRLQAGQPVDPKELDQILGRLR